MLTQWYSQCSCGKLGRCSVHMPCCVVGHARFSRRNELRSRQVRHLVPNACCRVRHAASQQHPDYLAVNPARQQRNFARRRRRAQRERVKGETKCRPMGSVSETTLQRRGLNAAHHPPSDSAAHCSTSTLLRVCPPLPLISLQCQYTRRVAKK